MAYVNVHVNWGGVGHVNVPLHLCGMLMLWAMLTYVLTGVGWAGTTCFVFGVGIGLRTTRGCPNSLSWIRCTWTLWLKS